MFSIIMEHFPPVSPLLSNINIGEESNFFKKIYRFDVNTVNLASEHQLKIRRASSSSINFIMLVDSTSDHQFNQLSNMLKRQKTTNPL